MFKLQELIKLDLVLLVQHILEVLAITNSTKVKMMKIGTKKAKQVSLMIFKTVRKEVNSFLKIEQDIRVNGEIR